MVDYQKRKKVKSARILLKREMLESHSQGTVELMQTWKADIKTNMMMTVQQLNAKDKANSFQKPPPEVFYNKRCS